MEEKDVIKLWEKLIPIFNLTEIHHFILSLQKSKPYLRIVSVQFVEKNYEEQTAYPKFVETGSPAICCFKAQNTLSQQMITLKVYFLERIKDLTFLDELVQKRSLSSKLQRTDLILQVFDSYTISLNDTIQLYHIIEQELVHMELIDYLEQTQSSAAYQYRQMVQQIMKAEVEYCTEILENQNIVKQNVFENQFYIVKSPNKIIIKLNLLNVAYQAYETKQNLNRRGYSIIQINREEEQDEENDQQYLSLFDLISYQLNEVKRKRKIKPSELIDFILECVPKFLQYHSIELLLQIISEKHYKYFQMGEYAEGYFTFVVQIGNSKYKMKVERFSDLESGQKVLQLYESYYSIGSSLFIPLREKKLIQLDGQQEVYILIVEEMIRLLNDEEVEQIYEDQEEYEEKEEDRNSANMIEYEILEDEEDEEQGNKYLNGCYMTLKSFFISRQNDTLLKALKMQIIVDLVKSIDKIYSNGLKLQKCTPTDILIQSSKIKSLQNCSLTLRNQIFQLSEERNKSNENEQNNVQQIIDIFRILTMGLNMVLSYEENQLWKEISFFCNQIVKFQEPDNNMSLLEYFPRLELWLTKLENLVEIIKTVQNIENQEIKYYLQKYQICLRFNKFIYEEIPMSFHKNIDQLSCSPFILEEILSHYSESQIHVNSLKVMQKDTINENYNYASLEVPITFEVTHFSNMFPNLRKLTVQIIEEKQLEFYRKFSNIFLIPTLSEVSILRGYDSAYYQKEKYSDPKENLEISQNFFRIFSQNKHFNTIYLGREIIDQLLKINYFRQKYGPYVQRFSLQNEFLEDQQQQQHVSDDTNQNGINAEDFLKKQQKYECKYKSQLTKLFQLHFSQEQFKKLGKLQQFKIIDEIKQIKETTQSILIHVYEDENKLLHIDFEDPLHPEYQLLQNAVRYYPNENKLKLEYKDQQFGEQLECNLNENLNQFNKVNNWIYCQAQFVQMKQFLGKGTPYCCSHNQDNFFQLNLVRGQSNLKAIFLYLKVCDSVNSLLKQLNSNYFMITENDYPQLNSIYLFLSTSSTSDKEDKKMLTEFCPLFFNSISSHKNINLMHVQPFKSDSLSTTYAKKAVRTLKRLVLLPYNLQHPYNVN